MSELSEKALGIAVAKEVMEWHQSEQRKHYHGLYPLFIDEGSGNDCLVIYRSDYSHRRYWAPWRDMNDAWEVVEKLRENQWRFCLSDLTNIYGTQWHVWLHKGTYGPRVEHSGNVLCEAILRAALKAVGGESH